MTFIEKFLTISFSCVRLRHQQPCLSRNFLCWGLLLRRLKSASIDQIQVLHPHTTSTQQLRHLRIEPPQGGEKDVPRFLSLLHRCARLQSWYCHGRCDRRTCDEWPVLTLPRRRDNQGNWREPRVPEKWMHVRGIQIFDPAHVQSCISGIPIGLWNKILNSRRQLWLWISIFGDNLPLGFFSLLAIRTRAKPNPREKGGRLLHRTEYKETMFLLVAFMANEGLSALF